VSVLERGLSKNGFATAVAEDGEAAQRMALDGEFDLLILDLGLPLKSGIEVLEELRSRGNKLPVLVLTGQADYEAAAFAAGADDYMRKPFQVSELVARVRAQLPAGGAPDHERGGVSDLRPHPVDGGLA
jgi:two-component system copper resistance phosphate regulon response regulator CusR